MLTPSWPPSSRDPSPCAISRSQSRKEATPRCKWRREVTQASDTPAPNRMFALLTPLQTERWRQPEANVLNASGPSITLLVASAAAPPPQQQLGGTCFTVFYAGVDQTTEHKRVLRTFWRRPSRRPSRHPPRCSPRRPPPGLRCWQPGARISEPPSCSPCNGRGSPRVPPLVA